MFSATFPQPVQETAKMLLKEGYVFISVGIVGSANIDIKQEFIRVNTGGLRSLTAIIDQSLQSC